MLWGDDALGKPTLYFFIEKKNEALLCEEFVTEIHEKLETNVYGEIRSFKEVFGYLMELSQNRHFTLIIDEFQEFRNINSSIYSEMQNIWDANKNRSQLNLILCGSVYSLMKQIFENSREPLFGRATARIQVRSFYLFTGGVAKYVELLADAKAFTLESIVNEVFSENSLFLDEGYFSILSLIALSKTSRPEIESVLNMNIGGFLDKLENEYGLITKVRPILSKPAGKNVI